MAEDTSLYVVAFSGDAACATLVRGFNAMVDFVVEQFLGQGVARDDEERLGWEEALRNGYNWTHVRDREESLLRYHESLEDCSIEVIRITDDLTQKEAARG